MKKTLLKGMLLFAAFAFGTNLNAQTYCAVSTTSGDYLSGISSSGAVVDIGYTASSQPSGSYSDQTALAFESYETQSFDITTTYVGGTNGIAIWVDWNDDVLFDASELVASQNSTDASKTFTITVPSGTPQGSYRMRVRGLYNSIPPACGSVTWGSTVDFELEISTPPSCLPPQTLTVSNVGTTTLDFGWTEVNQTAATEWQIETGASGFTPGTGVGTVISNVTASPHTLAITQGTEYDFYVRSVCAVGDSSIWAGPYEFKYCEVSTSYTGDYLSEVVSSGALANINYTATTQPAGSYADETSQTFVAFDTQSFDINTNYVGGTHGVGVWVDWDKDMTFAASEMMAGQVVSGATQTLNITVPTGTALGNYRVRVRGLYNAAPTACGIGTHGSTIDFNLEIVTSPNCLPPNSLTVNNVSETSLDLGWTENGTATTWNIEYGPTGFTSGTGTMVSGITTNPYTITGLTGNTNYEFYVQADCGVDSSYWSATTGNIITACGVYEANGFCEGFDINLSPTIGCWRVRDANQDGDNWAVSTQNPNTGAYSAIINTDYNAGANDDYLITPPMVLTGIEAMKFSYAVQSSTEPNDFQVLLSTTGNATADFTDTLMALAQYDNTDYMDTVVDLTAYTGTVYIAFHVPPGGLDGWMLFIDDVCFGECIPTPGQGGTVDVCSLDGLTDLTDGIVSHNNSYGHWEFPANQELIVDDTMFNIELMAEGSHEVLYIVEGLCQADTTIATINVFRSSSAGIDGDVTVCKNEPTNLLSALSGNVDLGGTWYDPSNNALPNSQPKAPNVQGMYQYTYVTSNGFCPADSSIVTITVDGTCNFLALGDEMLTDVSVYPNPATSILTVVNPSNAAALKVEMLDMNGRVVLAEDKALNNASEATLEIEHLEKGIYTLRVFNAEGQKTFKIVKQ